ncbi:MAG: D-alanyl-D-alanine carboxypeptidase/D-alanyl-D-alanine-endopeptidase [Betaproteobacteria bacterium]|nr:D-alanyl-D-alanine carboxypeptidase/D-alanyl-D-alanine-endopeptidase [Betaproteobacteria bacterium]
MASLALAAPARLPPDVRALLAAERQNGARVGLYVRDLARHRPAVALDADAALAPASTLKLVTTYAALSLLGPAYTWKTEVYTDPGVVNGVVPGNLYLKGYGDPDLTLQRIWLLIHRLRLAGVREIRGDLVLDDSDFALPPGDPGAFDGHPLRPYNVTPSALLFNFNDTVFRFLPDAQEGRVSVQADPGGRRLRIACAMTLASGPCGDWEDGISARVGGTPEHPSVRLAGRYPLRCGPAAVNLSVLPKDDYIYQIFRELWTQSGGAIDGTVRRGAVPADAALRLTFRSPPLADVIRAMNKFSNNVMARQIFLTLGAAEEGAPATLEKAAQAVAGFLHGQGLDFPELVLDNGCGLSRIARISPRHLGEVLAAAARSPWASEFESSLPIVGVDGTMAHRLLGEPVAGHAHIKTGTLDGVTSIAGYVDTRRGHHVVVVCIANDAHGALGRRLEDRLLEWVYENL